MPKLVIPMLQKSMLMMRWIILMRKSPADLALLRSGAETAVTECGHSAETMAQMAEQARAIVAAGKVEVLEDAAADLSARPAAA